MEHPAEREIHLLIRVGWMARTDTSPRQTPHVNGQASSQLRTAERPKAAENAQLNSVTFGRRVPGTHVLNITPRPSVRAAVERGEARVHADDENRTRHGGMLVRRERDLSRAPEAGHLLVGGNVNAQVDRLAG